MCRSPRWGGSALFVLVLVLVLVLDGARAQAQEKPAAPAPAPAPAAQPAEPPAKLEAPPLPDVQEGVNLVANFVKLVAILGGMAALGALVVRVLGPRLSPLNARPGDLIHVVDVKRLDAKTALYVIEVGGKHALIAVSEHQVKGLSLLELDDELIREKAQKRDGGTTQKVPFASLLTKGAAK